MRFKKVLLVNPQYSTSYFSIPVLPTGLGYLANSLKEKGIEYEIFDMSLGYTVKELKKKIEESEPELVGISCMSYKLNDTYQMILEIKKCFPHLKIALGGPHPSSVKEKVFKECPELDFSVEGEGEFSLVELCSEKDLKDIRGLSYRRNCEVIFTGPRNFIDDLDGLGFPKYEGFELKKYGYGIGIVSSRGCPYVCIYCSCNVIGKVIRFRSAQSVVDEIEYWHKLGYREFGFQEDNPTFDKARMFEICEKLQRRNLKDLRLMCGNGVRADRVDRQLLVEMRKAGFKRLAFGIESGSDKVLKAIKKGTTVAVMDEAIRQAVETGFFVSLFFLVGSPAETPADVEESIRLALKYPVHQVDFFNLVPMPGSELYRWVEENKNFVRRPAEYLNAGSHPARSTKPIFETPEFSRQQRSRALLKTHQISIFIKRNALKRQFPKAGMLGKIIFRIYCTDTVSRLENRLLCNELFRNTIGNLRMQIRNMFYKR